MIIQIHTDPHIERTEQLTGQVEALVTSITDGLQDQISRIQVHLGDENSHKSGTQDKRCMIEARIEGRPPIAVVEKATTLEQAMNGAAAKLERSMESALARLRGR